jgi:hypothetical protein
MKQGKGFHDFLLLKKPKLGDTEKLFINASAIAVMKHWLTPAIFVLEIQVPVDVSKERMQSSMVIR